MLFTNVKLLCDSHNISVWALERELGIANGTIGKWNGKGRSPRIETVKAVADYFGCTVDELLKEGE